MISKEEIKQELLRLSECRQDIVRRGLNIGDLVSANLNRGKSYYKIDDLNIIRMMGETGKIQPNSIPYMAIDSHFHITQVAPEIFPAVIQEDGSKVVNFSRAVQMKSGGALEKAILVQIAGQYFPNIFLIYGMMSMGYAQKPYTFNVILSASVPFLVDAHGMRRAGAQRPYLVPLLGIEQNQFLIDPLARGGRTYSLPHY